MMCKLARWACATAFVLICCGVLAFMNIFSQSDPSFSYPSWEYAAVVSPSGAETPFDPTGLPPQLEEGEHYRFSLTLPEDRLDSIMLVFETTNLDVAVFLDDQEIWYSASTQDASSIGLSQTQLPLPPVTRLTPLTRGPADSAHPQLSCLRALAPQLSLSLPAAAAYFTVISTEDSAARSPEFTY